MTIFSDIKFFRRLVFPRMRFPYDIFFQGLVILTSSYSDGEFINEFYPTRYFAWRHGQQVPIDFENISGPSKSTTGVTLTNVLSCWFTNVCSNLAIKGASSLVSIRLWNFKDGVS
jgi:hypothetical protein